MRHVAQPPSHYEIELRQAARQNETTSMVWRPVRRVGPDETMAPLTFGSLSAAQAYAKRLNRRETRVVAVERDGWRRVVDEAGT